MALTKLGYLSEVKRKIARKEPVSIGVFCTGNRDRSAFARMALERHFRELGYDNVKVFSFGVTAESSAPKRSNPRTLTHARAMGYDLSGHTSTSFRDALPNIRKADLLLAMSPSHLAIVAEMPSDNPEHSGLSRDILRKGWTLVGFGNRIEWTRRWRLLGGGIARGLALKDPHGLPETDAGERQWRKALENVESAAVKAVHRLVGNRRMSQR